MSRDSINTNLLQSNDKSVQLVQEIATQVVVSKYADDVLNDTLKKVINGTIKNALGETVYDSVSVSVNKSLKKVIVSKETISKYKNVFGKKMTSKIGNKLLKTTPNVLKQVAKSVAEIFAKKVAISATKTALKTAGQSAIENLTVGAMLCGTTGAATGGIGCLVGIMVTVILLAFDVLNLVLSLLDPGNISALMHRDTVEGIIKVTGQTMASEFPDQPHYFDEEILFDPDAYLFLITPEGDIVADPYWSDLYNAYQDEFMTNIGITGDWRSRLSVTALSLTTDPSVLSPDTINSESALTNLNTEITRQNIASTKTNTIFIIFLIIIFVFFIIFLTVI